MLRAINLSRRTTALAVFLALLAGACGDSAPEATREAVPGPEDRTLSVGSIDSAESQIVAQMYVQVLEKATYDAEPGPSFASQEELLSALEAGDVDLAPAYLASLAKDLDPDAAPSGDPAEVTTLVEGPLDERGLAILDPAPANSGQALIVSAETAKSLGLRTVGDLAPIGGELTLGGPAECEQAPSCLPGLRDVYGIEFGEFRPLEDPAEALKRGEIDVAVLPGTSARIREERWFVLEDDRQLQPAENITPLARKDALNEEIAQLLNAVSASISIGHLTLYNRSFEFGESPGTLAILHLNNARLLGGVSGASQVQIGTSPPADCVDARGGDLARVTAEDSAFSTGCLRVALDQRIEFVNKDEATPHTFTISEDPSFRPPYLLDLDDALGDQTLTSEPVGGSATPGGWSFFCRYHAYMNGQIWLE